MGSAEKPPGTPQAEAPPVETPADGSLPPVTPPKEQSGADAADDELAMRQPGFTSPLIKMGARTVEKLERVGVEAGALALPPLRDPVQCFRDAERRHARREICRRRMLLERYERHREQMLAIRHDLGVPDDDDEEAAEVIEESSEVVDGLRATVHSLRKELRRAERDHSVQSRRIDELEAVVVRKSEEARMAGERTNGATKLLRTAQKREQLYQQLHEELPYDSAVRPEKYIQRKDGSVEIHQQIVVMRDNQRMIVLGKGGSRIKAIGQAAREELSELLGQKVHLFLHVKTDERWSEDKEMFEEMGLDWKS